MRILTLPQIKEKDIGLDEKKSCLIGDDEDEVAIYLEEVKELIHRIEEKIPTLRSEKSITAMRGLISKWNEVVNYKIKEDKKILSKEEYALKVESKYDRFNLEKTPQNWKLLNLVKNLFSRSNKLNPKHINPYKTADDELKQLISTMKED